MVKVNNSIFQHALQVKAGFMSKITVLMNSKKGRERTEGQDSTSSPNQLMVNFLPPQQGFWGNRSYRTAMFVFAVLGQNFLPIPTHGCSVYQVLSGLPLSVSLSSCENLLPTRHVEGLDLALSISVSLHPPPTLMQHKPTLYSLEPDKYLLDLLILVEGGRRTG